MARLPESGPLRVSKFKKADNVIDLTEDDEDIRAHPLPTSLPRSATMSNESTESELIDLDPPLDRGVDITNNNLSDGEHELIEDDAEDADMRRAIALSLQDFEVLPPTSPQSRKGKERATSIDNSENIDELEELSIEKAMLSRPAMASTQHDQKPMKTVLPKFLSDAEIPRKLYTGIATAVAIPLVASHEPNEDEVSTQHDNAPLTNFFGLDRKAMEEERLTRLKRKREQISQDDIGSSKREIKKVTHHTGDISPPVLWRTEVRRFATSTSHTAETKQALPTTENVTPASSQNSKMVQKSGIDTTTPASQSSQTLHLPYPDGIVLQTYVDGFSAARTTTFAALIAPKPGLRSCILSSYIWDFDWLFSHFDPKITKFLLVMHAKTLMERESYLQDFQGIKPIRLCFPPMKGVAQCMHSKLMVLFYDDRARVVVPTANLVDFDWGVGAVMENTLWCIDLPNRKSTIGNTTVDSTAAGVNTDFKNSLVKFLEMQNVPVDAIRKLDEYDFSRTTDIRFVYSAAGTHEGASWRNVGLCGLGKAVRSLGLARTDSISVDFVASSIGSLNDEFMRSMYLACQGDDGLTEYTLRAVKSLPTKRLELGPSDREITIQKHTGNDWRANFRFYYPSQSTVSQSKGGVASAGTICFSRKWWEGVKFPRSNMRDCVSARNGLLMHNKMIFTRFQNATGGAERRFIGWTYIGSGNLSESAWGRLVQDRSSKTPKLNCRNWECGIIMPIKVSTDMDQTNELKIFNPTIPIPLKISAASYHQASKSIPWFSGGG